MSEVIVPEMTTIMASFIGDGTTTVFTYTNESYTFGAIVMNGVLINDDFVDEDDYEISYDFDDETGLTLITTFEIAPESLAHIGVLFAYFEAPPESGIPPDEPVIPDPEIYDPTDDDYDEPVDDEETFEAIILPPIRAELTDALFTSDDMKTLVKQISDYLDVKAIMSNEILVDEDTSIIFVLSIDADRYDLFKENYLGDDSLIDELTSVFAIPYESGVDDMAFGVLSFSIIADPVLPDVIECSFIGDGTTTTFTYEDEDITYGEIEVQGVFKNNELMLEEAYSVSADISSEDGLSITLVLDEAPENESKIDVTYTITYNEEES